MKNKKIIILSVSLLTLLLFYFYYENTFLKITHYNIVSSKIPDEFNNYKIIQISDYHNARSKRLNKDLIAKVKVENPNIIVITGDFIDSRKTNIDAAIKLIKNIKEIAPIYYVTGNHESRVSNYKELNQKLKEQSVITLENETDIIEVGNSKINIIGIDDPQMIFDSLVSDSIIIDKELELSNYDNNLFSILLSHRPELFSTYVENNIDLVLAGHAHGGQIRIPFVGGIVAPNQGIFPKYTAGLFNGDNTNMIVSRGVGNSIIPFRINNRPEVVSVTLINT